MLQLLQSQCIAAGDFYHGECYRQKVLFDEDELIRNDVGRTARGLLLFAKVNASAASRIHDKLVRIGATDEKFDAKIMLDLDSAVHLVNVAKRSSSKSFVAVDQASTMHNSCAIPEQLWNSSTLGQRDGRGLLPIEHAAYHGHMEVRPHSIEGQKNSSCHDQGSKHAPPQPNHRLSLIHI